MVRSICHLLCAVLVWTACLLPAQAQLPPTKPPATTPGQAGAEGPQPLRNPSADPTAPGTGGAGGAIVESPLETFYLKDDQGRPVPYFESLPYEVFDHLFKVHQGIEPPPEKPLRFVLKEMSMDGEVSAGQALLAVEFNVHVTQQGWVRVPLRLANAILAEPARFEGSGEQFVQFNAEEGGYQWWIRSPADADHKAVLKVIVPVQQVGGDTRLPLMTPRATTSSLKVVVPAARAVADPIAGAIMNAPRAVDPARTELKAKQVEGDFQLVWRDGSDQPAEMPAVLDVVGAVLVKFDGQRLTGVQADLKVTPLSGVLHSFVVRLPPGTRLAPQNQQPNQQRYKVSLVDIMDGAAPAPPGGQRPGEAPLVEVKLTAKTTDAVQVRVLAEPIPNGARTATPLEVAGFEVLGAVQQSGHIDLAVTGDWTLHCFEGPNVRRLSELPPMLTGVNARYEYFRQPCSLKIQILPKRTRVSVEPTYLIQIDPRRIQLDARFKYKIRGAREYELKVDMTGWIVDDVVPENLIQYDVINLDSVTPLAIPLVPLAQVSAGEFEVRLLAHRDLAAEQEAENGAEPTRQNGSLTFSLPKPQASTLLPATIVVLPADNVVLTPRPEEIQGLTPETSRPVLELPPRQQAPLYYRDRADAGPCTFAGDFQIHQREVTVAAANQLHVDQREVHVDQRLSYRIDYEPVAELVLDAPAGLLMSDSLEKAKLQISLDDQPLTFSVLGPPAPGDATQDRTLVRVDLPENRIGPCVLAVQYLVRLEDFDSRKSAPALVPLVMPMLDETTKLTGNSLRITRAENVQVESGGDDWLAAETTGSNPADDSAIRLSAGGPVNQAALLVTLARPNLRHATAISQAWIQTWLTQTDRRDRAVFHLGTSERQLRVQMPNGVVLDTLEVALTDLSGEAPVSVHVMEPAITDTGEVSIDVPGDAPQCQYVLELWYKFVETRSPRGSMAVEVPRIVDAAPAKRWYWQLAMPRDEHLIAAPRGLTPELTWRWQSIYWGQRSTLSQQDLEKWIGASSQARLAAGTSQYLFSSFGEIPRIEFQTAGRREILLAASFLALLAGLLLIYFPALRHPAVLFIGGVALVAGGLLYPEPALQAAQAAVVGLVLVVVARLLDWTVARRRDRHAVVRGTSLSGVDSHVSEHRSSRPEAGSQATTATALAPLPISASESKS
jgi:hypothetical protein